jgi:hypothetical protein
MKQGSCCKYTTFNPPASYTKLTVRNKAYPPSWEVEVRWPQNVTNTQYYHWPVPNTLYSEIFPKTG